MRRRSFLGAALALTNAAPLFAIPREPKWEKAAEVLDMVVKAGQVRAAALHVAHKGDSFTRHFGEATDDSMFLLGSISKPIATAALLTLLDQKRFQLDDYVEKHLPEFTGEGRGQATIRHLLTHTSGLPDQLAANNELRAKNASLSEFVTHAVHAPLAFAPGTRYRYSSMGILLAARIGEILGESDILTLVDRNVFQPLGMKRSAQGLGRFKLDDMIPCQMEGAAPESGGGDPKAGAWNWNSPYWRKLGAPWGGTHASALDIARFLGELMGARGRILKPETARLMTTNQNPAGIEPRGLGFSVGAASNSRGCSDRVFGHTGSTGTRCWADPASDTICVVLTSLPGSALRSHPRDLAAQRVAEAARQ